MIQSDSVPFTRGVVVPNYNLQELTQSMRVNQMNSSSVISFENCSGITIGSNFFINASTLPAPAVTNANSFSLDMDETEIYRKTPTIKEMLESKEPMSSAFQELVAQSLGTRWEEISVLLGISEIIVENLYEDNFKKGGIKEVNEWNCSRYRNNVNWKF